MNKKPEWLLYAEKVRERLANMQDTKSGKRTEVAMRSAYLEAWEKFGYEGSFDDWEFLMRRRPPR